MKAPPTQISFITSGWTMTSSIKTPDAVEEVSVMVRVVGVVRMMVRVVSEVIVRSLAIPVIYAAPAPTSIATTSREAMAPFLMPQRAAPRGVLSYS